MRADLSESVRLQKDTAVATSSAGMDQKGLHMSGKGDHTRLDGHGCSAEEETGRFISCGSVILSTWEVVLNVSLSRRDRNDTLCMYHRICSCCRDGRFPYDITVIIIRARQSDILCVCVVCD